MSLELIVNIHPLEKRIAVLENGKLVEFIIEKPSSTNIVSNIYKGIVKDVLPGMGAAFIDLGLERTAFLHYSDIVTDYMDNVEGDGKVTRMSKDSSKIGQYLQAGQEVIVQIQKGPINKKGARLTGQISIPGKYLVFFPNKGKVSISRKINSMKEKKRLRKLIMDLKEPEFGVIVRTEAEGCSDEELASEYKALAKSWRLMEKQIKHALPPVCIFDENKIQNTLIRDLFRDNVTRVVVDDKEFIREMKAEISDISSDLIDRIELYDEDSPIFDAFGIERKIKTIFSSKAYLPSGGNIQIDQTEALVAIDVNTGSFTGRSNYEETVCKTNKEAAAEVARQIRLRDLSGIIIVDFIDMNYDTSREAVHDVLRKELKKDRARNKAYPFGPLGLVEITRKRIRPSIISSYSESCAYCSGTGRVLSGDAIIMTISRWLNRAEYFIKDDVIRVEVHPDIKAFILNNPDYIYSNYSFKLEFTSNHSLRRDHFKVYRGHGDVDITEKYST
ncbi:MAG: ribonuclease E/G [Candidatus Cloacimonetes bacterium 4572_65]|nr:MAG: ribonuclease E/G [Candidatus Cloacimonetes bacterium 4572_65]